MIQWYVLNDDNIPVKSSFEEFTSSKKQMGYSLQKDLAKNCRVSTVFLGFDHGYGETESPLLFETMVFDGDFDGYQMRYSTYEDAMKGHQEIVQKILNHN